MKRRGVSTGQGHTAGRERKAYLSNGVGRPPEDKVKDDAAGGEDDKHGGKKVAFFDHFGRREGKDVDGAGDQDGLAGERGAGAHAADDGQDVRPHQVRALLDDARNGGHQTALLVVGIAVAVPLHLHAALLLGRVARQGALQVGGIERRSIVGGCFIRLVRVRLGRGRDGQALDRDEVSISAASREQGLVRALLDDAARRHDDDIISLADRRQLVRNGNGGAAAGRAVEGLLHDALGVRVERAGGLVEEQHRGLGDDAAGNGDALLLAAGQ